MQLGVMPSDDFGALCVACACVWGIDVYMDVRANVLVLCRSIVLAGGCVVRGARFYDATRSELSVDSGEVSNDSRVFKSVIRLLSLYFLCYMS